MKRYFASDLGDVFGPLTNFVFSFFLSFFASERNRAWTLCSNIIHGGRDLWVSNAFYNFYMSQKFCTLSEDMPVILGYFYSILSHNPGGSSWH